MFAGYLFVLLLTTLVYYQSTSPTLLDQETSSAFDKWVSNQETTSFNTMLHNINPPGTKRGFFAASLSTHRPDYFYTWTRDAALVARVLTSLPETNDTLLKDYIDFQMDTQSTPTRCNCLGEPKFNTDGSGYTGFWGRPQNDGPAERAMTFLLIANRWLDNGHKEATWIYDTLVPAIVQDLDYVSQVWYQPSYDLWEEIEGVHFYTLMVMRRALLDAIDFFATSNHNVEQYKLTAFLITKRIASFWSSQHNYIVATQNVQNGVQKPSGLDVSTLLAANLVASRNDGFFTPGSDKVLATVVALEDSFIHLYPINSQQSVHLGTCIGRYPEDIYDGYDTSVGNPWFLATAAYTELYYLAIKEWKQVGVSVNDINRHFFKRIQQNIDDGYYAPDSAALDQLINNTEIAANKFLATIQYHQDKNGSISEQYDRYIGFMAGARDLTWSHAAFISAAKARAGSPIH